MAYVRNSSSSVTLHRHRAETREGEWHRWESKRSSSASRGVKFRNPYVQPGKKRSRSCDTILLICRKDLKVLEESTSPWMEIQGQRWLRSPRCWIFSRTMKVRMTMQGRYRAQTHPHLQSNRSSPHEDVKRGPGEADSSTALMPSATMTLIIAFKNTASKNMCAARRVICLGLCGGTSLPRTGWAG